MTRNFLCSSLQTVLRSTESRWPSAGIPRSETTVRAPSIVMTNPLRQESTEMPFAQRDLEIQTLASYGPDQSFTKCRTSS